MVDKKERERFVSFVAIIMCLETKTRQFFTISDKFISLSNHCDTCISRSGDFHGHIQQIDNRLKINTDHYTPYACVRGYKNRE